MQYKWVTLSFWNCLHPYEEDKSFENFQTKFTFLNIFNEWINWYNNTHKLNVLLIVIFNIVKIFLTEKKIKIHFRFCFNMNCLTKIFRYASILIRYRHIHQIHRQLIYYKKYIFIFFQLNSCPLYIYLFFVYFVISLLYLVHLRYLDFF